MQESNEMIKEAAAGIFMAVMFCAMTMMVFTF